MSNQDDSSEVPDELSTILKDELDQERERKKSLEQRGITVITSSGAIATLVFAVSSFVTKTPSITSFLHREETPIKLSLAFLILAATLGVITNVPFRYGNIKAYALFEHYQRSRQDPERFRARVADSYVDILRRHQYWNFVKSELLLGALIAQLIGIILLATAVYRLVGRVL